MEDYYKLKSTPPTPAKTQPTGPVNPPAPAAVTSVPAQKTPAKEPKTIIDQVAEFIGRYLQCTEHERNVLALWVLHAHCFEATHTTPYISISGEKQSGKTLCLQLLGLLCPNPALSSGVTAATLSKRTDAEDRPTFLLDEAQITLGSRSRSKNPTLRGLLISGFQRGIGYSDSKRERNLFSPKAFAGTGPLPEPLAERSLPIILEPLGAQSPSAANQRIKRFNPVQAQEEVKPIMEQLQNWVKEHFATLKATRAYPRDKFPPNLNPRHQDMIEPLLQLADALGGIWPERARNSLTGLFEDQVKRENKINLKLLDDVREAFVHYGRPAKLATAALVAYLQSLPNRPWNQENPINAQRLSAMLAVFNIRSRSQRIKGSEKYASPHRGYIVRDFMLCWATYLPEESPVNFDGSMRYDRYPGTREDAEQWCIQADRQEILAVDRAEKEAERKQLVKDQKLEKLKQKTSGKPKNDAGCSSVAASPKNRPVETLHATSSGQKEEMTEEQKALWAEVRRMQNSLPACADREMVRVAPSFLRR